MEKDGTCKMDRQNKKCSSRKSGRRKNNAGTDKEEENKLAGTLDKKELPAEWCSRRYGKWEESSRQKKIPDDIQHYDKWTVGRYEKEGWEEGRVENAEFVAKDLPLGRTLWLIDWLISPKYKGWMALFTVVQHLCVFNIVVPLVYHLLSNVWKAPYTNSASLFVDAPYSPPYCTDKFFSCVVPDPLQGFFSLWRRDRNHMDSYRVSTEDVPDSPIASGARGPWQQWCDSFHCREE